MFQYCTFKGIWYAFQHKTGRMPFVNSSCEKFLHPLLSMINASSSKGCISLFKTMLMCSQKRSLIWFEVYLTNSMFKVVVFSQNTFKLKCCLFKKVFKWKRKKEKLFYCIQLYTHILFHLFVYTSFNTFCGVAAVTYLNDSIHVPLKILVYCT